MVTLICNNITKKPRTPAAAAPLWS